MSQSYAFTVLGGDARHTVLCRRLTALGHPVAAFHVSGLPDAAPTLMRALSAASCVILPIPAFSGGYLRADDAFWPLPASALLPALPPRCLLFGGGLGPYGEELQAAGHTVVDLSSLPPVAAESTVATAEGALQLAMEALPVTLHGTSVLVIGWGKIGKVLTHRLRALGAQVTVSVRDPSARLLAQSLDLPADLTGQYSLGLGQYQLIVNTVPAPVLTEAQLAETDPDCCFLELASTPGGFDPALCRRLGRTAIVGRGLPGKVAPVTTGEALADGVLAYLSQHLT